VIAFELDPSRLDPYLELLQLYRRVGHEAESRNILREYLRSMPQNIELRLPD